ncbi:MAG: ferrous iron transport protein A [Clostridia bacterium]|nr:ferrous iron transport protein A [Clostridia bacterium]
MRMSDLLPNQSGRVECIENDASGRLSELGLTRGSTVRCLFRAPTGDPTAYLIRDVAVALRRHDAAKVRLMQ